MTPIDVETPTQGRLTEPVQDLLAEIWSSVLGRPSVEPQESFFEIGGDSMSAVLVLLQLEEATGLQVQPALFFQNPRLGDLARAVEALSAAPTEIRSALPRLARADGATFPLSPPQRQLWFLDRLDPNSAAYNVPLAWRIRGPLDRERLAGALDGIVARHEILRTVYLEEDGAPRQRVLPQAALPLEIRDLTAVPGEARDAAWRREVNAFVAEPFDLERGPVIRALLLILAPDDVVLALCVHHIAFDGWSTGVLVRDLAALYAGETLPPALQYADYAAALAEELDGPARDALVAHWRRALEGVPASQELPADRPRRSGGRGRAGVVEQRLEGARLDDLTRLARESDTTLFVVILAALDLVVGRATRQRDVVIGTPMANRSRPELLGAVGFFVNSLVLRNAVEGETPVADYLSATGRAVQSAFSHQALPFDMLVEIASPQRALDRNPIFNVMLALQNAPDGDARLGEATLTPVAVGNPTAKFDLLLNVTPGSDGLDLAWEYDTGLFERASIEGLAAQFAQAIDRFVADPAAPLDAIALRPAAEQALVDGWNRTERPLAAASIVAAFSCAAARRGEAVAVVEGARRLTYAELATLSDDLAARLQRRGVGRGEVIGLLLPRGIAAVVGMLGILKAGAAYLPLDPEHPPARLAFMAEDAGLRFVVVDRLPAAAPEGVEALLAEAEEASGVPEPAPTGPRDPCYLMYTSGSTGNPKGVLVPQEGILRLVLDPGFVTLGETTVMLHATSISFDTSAFEIWGALLNGGRLVIYPDRFDAREVADLMRAERVDCLWMTSGVLEVFVSALDGPLPDLRWLVAGGDVVPPKAVAALYRDNPELLVVNGYGPTENSVLTCCHPIPRDLDTDRAIPIGRPIANTAVEVIDLAGRPAPIGTPGELICAGGPVGLGYHRREALNAERFPPDPDRPGLRLYRTGDLVRWRRDGVIEFFGRIDNQLKIRGFRVEPGEIETALQRHPDVALGAVTVHGEGASERFLVGWVKPAPGRSVDLPALRAFLETELPAASRPAHLRVVDEIPATVNGKIDRRALAERFTASATRGGALHGPTETRLAEIWSRLLRLDGGIGPQDDFFELGGNSLMAVRLVAQVNEAFGTGLAVRAVFQAPSLSDLARLVESEASPMARTRSTDRLVRLARGGADALWVAFPGIGSSSAAFLSLAQALAADAGPGLCVLEPRGLLPGEAPHETVADMASEATARLLAEPDRGAVTLLGHSFGGRVAFETARSLAAHGRRVDLVLLDSLPGNALADVRLADLGDSDEAAARWLADSWSIDAAGRHPVDALRDSGLVAGEQVDAMLAQARAAFRANRAYRPSGVLAGGGVLLIYAAQSLIGAHPEEAILRELRVWCPAADALRVPGDHFSMLRDGRRLADALASAAVALA